ncbi:hypothetical protein C8R43DRAFT_1113653 [Mycena crocata]|nr:hypothetical protein C8R43DRAFT_1113653 [Mycena crocata]
MRFIFVLQLLPVIASAFAAFLTKVVYDSPTGLFLENIAVRPCNKLLLTSESVMSPTLHTLDPTATNATLDELYTFHNSTGITGIVEYQPDIYAVVASKLDLVARCAELGSVAIWRVDLTGSTPHITRAAKLLDSVVTNGLSAVPDIGSDSVLGLVYQISMHTGASHIAIQDEVMAPGAPAPEHVINGLRVHGDALYFANSQRGTFARVPMALDALPSVGEVEAAGQQFGHSEMDGRGRAWVARHPDALIFQYPLENGTWAQEKVARSLREPTPAAFGRGSKAEKAILYVTNGGGQLVSVDTSGVDA